MMLALHFRPMPEGCRPMWRLYPITLAALLAVPTGAGAQLGTSPLPGLPNLPAGLPGQVQVPGERVDAGRVTGAVPRLVALRRLVEAHPDVIDVDPRGAPIVRGELLAIAPAPEVLDRVRAAGFTVAADAALAGLDLQIVTLKMPAGMAPGRALRILRRIDPDGVYDFNHLYTRAGDVAPEPPNDHAGPGAVARPTGAAAVKIGLLDGGVNSGHPALRGAAIRRWGCAGAKVPSEHGTAVASLLVGQAPGFSGVLPAGTLYAADVYCGQATGGNVLTLATALSWLAAEKVAVINVSLVGPANTTLKRVIRQLVTRQVLVVAAVGNDGPTAPPLYPAAYPGVVGVTGVDGRQRALIEAGRGPHVWFAAPGADMAAAAGADGYVAVRGTSFAAPVVAGLLALELTAAGPEAACSRLAAAATDLGRRGRDDVYGAGLVGERYRVLPAALAGLTVPAR